MRDLLGDCRFDLDQNITGKKNYSLYRQAGIRTITQLLGVLPLRYQDKSRIFLISELLAGDSCQIKARVVKVQPVLRGKNMLLVTVEDDNGDQCVLRFFHYYPSYLKTYQIGRKGIFYGKVQDIGFNKEIIHPQATWLKEDDLIDELPKIVPIYPAIKGVSVKDHQKVIDKAIKSLSDEDDFFTNQGFISYKKAVQIIHQPVLFDDWVNPLEDPDGLAMQRLIFEELSVQQLMAIKAREIRLQETAQSLPKNQPLYEKLKSLLPFELTGAQEKAISEISEDLTKSCPMLRLLQGDVGSGKTIVGLAAILQALSNKKQAALMLPTELLANQQFNKIQPLLEKLGFSTILLISKQKSAIKRQNLQKIAKGKVDLIIGTHALFQEKVIYCDLALVVIDEQHRFGVNQRLELKQKAHVDLSVHQLLMTATPIPRTLAMTNYAEMDLSIINQMPKGREIVQTILLDQKKRMALIKRVGAFCQKGRQAYWVCPLIKESEFMSYQNAQEIYQQLNQLLPELTIGLVHGQIPIDERQQTMQDFSDGKIDLLVATTVIEVGVDVANAGLMIIENPERFGLAQLHQLRGRVGRGAGESFCVLLHSDSLSKNGKNRLELMTKTCSGFDLAEADWQLRGSGELFGTKQSGNFDLLVADLSRDSKYLVQISSFCHDLWRENPLFAEMLIKKWQGENQHYAQV